MFKILMVLLLSGPALVCSALLAVMLMGFLNGLLFGVG